MDYIKEANAMLDELIDYRRTIHRQPEIGFELPKTVAFVREKLEEFGYEPEIIEDSGVLATVGSGDKVVLLRADMDALPIKEESGEEFSSENNNMHACGHDLHATMLLGAAKLLKKNEAQLKGTVKLLFQPAEELLIGGKVMVDAGVLENPKVDVAIGAHVLPDNERGIYTRKGVLMASGNNFRITITGKGAHGAQPQNSIDPVNIGAHIVISAQEILARELPYDNPIVLTMGRFIADGSVNIIPNTATIEGTLRTFSNESQAFAKKRLEEIVKTTAETFRGEAEIEFLSDVPVLETNPELTESFRDYMEEISSGHFELREAPIASGSEDFAFVTQEVPSVHFWLGVPHPDLDQPYNLHHPKVRFDENQMPYGVAAYCHFATRWLEDQ